MKTLAKTLLFAAFFTLATGNIKAQTSTLPNSYVLLNNQWPEKTEFFTKSINAADMEQYRLRDKRARLEFENGFEMELYSAKELFVNGAKLNINNYPVTHGNNQTPVFNILPSGHLAAKVFSESKK